MYSGDLGKGTKPEMRMAVSRAKNLISQGATMIAHETKTSSCITTFGEF